MNNLTGQKFGKWTVIERAKKPEYIKKKKPGVFWLCHCDCGNKKVVLGENLISGKSKSCGCSRFKYTDEERELNKELNKDKYKGRYKVSDIKYKLRKSFGITLEEYNLMFEDQNGCCAICGKPQSEFSRRFAVDHDHITGEVRGLLCPNCNLALGYAYDDIEILQNAISYLCRGLYETTKHR